MTVAATDSQIEQDQNCRVQRQQHFDPKIERLKGYFIIPDFE